MKRSRFTEEQIIGILKEQEAGAATADVCRRHGISSATFYKWKAKYGGLEVSEARRLKALEDDNARLKKLLAESMLNEAALRDFLGKFMVRPVPARVLGEWTGTVCVNVSGLSRVGCCCSQAMMRSARAFPNNGAGTWPVFFTGLTARRSTASSSRPRPRSLLERLRHDRIAACVEGSGFGQHYPGDAGDLGGQRDRRLVGMHSLLKLIDPAPQLVP